MAHIQDEGVYVGMANDDYHADRALSSSGGKLLLKSPYKYYTYSAFNPKPVIDESTVATKFGTAYHTLILEPEKFAYKVKPGTKTSGGEGYLGEEEFKMLNAMRDEILCEPERVKLLSGGVPEVSFFWRDEATGIMCRIRIDYFTPEAFTDLKTTTNVSNSNLRYEIPKRGWDVSGAMYCVGSQRLKQMIRAGYQMPAAFSPAFVDAYMQNEDQIFAFMSQEKEAPFEVRTLLLTQAIAQIGVAKMREAVELYAQYQNLEGKWPSKYPVFENMEIENISNNIYYDN